MLILMRLPINKYLNIEHYSVMSQLWVPGVFSWRSSQQDYLWPWPPPSLTLNAQLASLFEAFLKIESLYSGGRYLVCFLSGRFSVTSRRQLEDKTAENRSKNYIRILQGWFIQEEELRAHLSRSGRKGNKDKELGVNYPLLAPSPCSSGNIDFHCCDWGLLAILTKIEEFHFP